MLSEDGTAEVNRVLVVAGAVRLVGSDHAHVDGCDRTLAEGVGNRDQVLPWSLGYRLVVRVGQPYARLVVLDLQSTGQVAANVVVQADRRKLAVPAYQWRIRITPEGEDDRPDSSVLPLVLVSR